MKIVRVISIVLVILVVVTSLFLGSCAARTEPVSAPADTTATVEPAGELSALLSNTEVAVTAVPGSGAGTDHTGFLVGEFLDSAGGIIRFNGFGGFSMENYSGQVIDGSYTLIEYDEQTILTLAVEDIVTAYTYTVAAGYGAFTLTDATENIIFFTPVCYD